MYSTSISVTILAVSHRVTLHPPLLTQVNAYSNKSQGSESKLIKKREVLFVLALTQEGRTCSHGISRVGIKGPIYIRPV